MRVLVVNAGSSSLKLSVLSRRGGTGSGWEEEDEGEDLDALLAGLPGAVDAVGHRFVHGGERSTAVVVDAEVEAGLADMTPFAPLHQPGSLDGVRRCREALPYVPQVACFDTAFHTTLPPAATTPALPSPWRETLAVRGFHGLSYAWSGRRVAELVPGARRVVVAHLGAGASLAGLLDGRSVVHTMGATPLDGLVMASRPGSLDPGAVAWLAGQPDVDLTDLLWRRSGLTGLAGTGDTRELLARADAGDADARLALDVWSHRLLVATGGVVAALGGLDALVLTGGIGENAAGLRRRLCEGLAFLGVGDVADDVPGGAADGFLSAPGAPVAVLRVHAREDLQVADEVAALMGGGAAHGGAGGAPPA